MSPSDGTRRAFLLDKLRASGLPDARARAGNGYAAPIVNILSMPSGFFFSAEQIAAMKRGKSIIDASQCTPMLLEHDEPTPPALETSAPVTIEIDVETRPVLNGGTFPRLVTESPDDDNHAA